MTDKLRTLKRRYQQAKREGDRDRYWKARREYLLEQGRRYERAAERSRGRK